MDPSGQSLRVAAVFDRSAATYEAVDVAWFDPIAAGLVRELAPRPGEHALDIGCGRGAALLPIARAVGPDGHVTGFDLAEQMVALTQADVDAEGLTNVDLLVRDASDPGLPQGAYDLIACSLVAFFLPDPPTAVAGWHGLLRPGGRLGLSTFGERDAVWVALDAVFRPYLPPQMRDARTTGETGPFGSDAGVEGLLRDAGFHQPRTTHAPVSVTFRDAEHWHTWSWSHGQRAMWEFVPEEERASVKAAAFDCLATVTDPDGRIQLTQGVRYTLGDRDPA
jgi:ubiquinone/menaquinone biosynthesis C-methylase UbiE